MNKRRASERVTVYENEVPTLRDRVWDQHPTDYLTTSNVEAIYWTVFDEDGEEITGLAYDADDLLYDTLQTGAEWDLDGVGFNFRHTWPGQVFTTGGRRYRAEYRFVIYDDGADAPIRELALEFDIHTRALRSR